MDRVPVRACAREEGMKAGVLKLHLALAVAALKKIVKKKP